MGQSFLKAQIRDPLAVIPGEVFDRIEVRIAGLLIELDGGLIIGKGPEFDPGKIPFDRLLLKKMKDRLTMPLIAVLGIKHDREPS